MRMNSRSLQSLLRLRRAFESDARLALISELDAEIEKDMQIKAISSKMNALAEEYSLARDHHGEKSEEARSAKEKLLLAKKELDELPLVVRYNEAYRVSSGLMLWVNDILFGDLVSPLSRGSSR